MLNKMEMVGASSSKLSTVLVEEHHWPVLRCTYPKTLNKAEIDMFVVSLTRSFERAHREGIHLATVADLRPVHFALSTGELRQYLVTSLAGIDDKFPGVQVCDAVVVSSPLVRLAVATMARLRLKRTHVTRCFENIPDAMRWAELTLRSNNKKAAGQSS